MEVRGVMPSEQIAREIACRLANDTHACKPHEQENGIKLICDFCGDVYVVGEGHLQEDNAIFGWARWPHGRERRNRVNLSQTPSKDAS